MVYIYKTGDREYTVELEKDTYVKDGSLALSLVHRDSEGYPEHLMRLTVWHVIKPAEGCVWIKDYSENEGIADWIEANGIAIRTGEVLPNGFVLLIEMKLRV